LAGRASIEVYLPGEPGRGVSARIGYHPQSGDPLEAATGLAWGLALASGVGGATSAQAQRVRVVHAHNHEAALPALVVKRLTGVPLVVTLHLPAPPEHRALERRLLESADAVIAVSSALATEYVERGWRIPRPMVIPNGVDAEFYTPGPAMAREPGRLLVAGRLTSQKGVDLAIRALGTLVPELPELRLFIAGAGPWEQAYRNLARRLGCTDRVRWLGWLDPEALRDQYRRCTALLMPSRYEPFGLTALEAMACGATVVAAAVGGLSELLDDGVTGRLVPPSDPAALAEAVGALIRDPVGADRLGVAATEAARQLTWERAAEATLGVYERLNFGSLRPLPTSVNSLGLARAEIAAALRGDPATRPHR